MTEEPQTPPPEQPQAGPPYQGQGPAPYQPPPGWRPPAPPGYQQPYSQPPPYGQPYPPPQQYYGYGYATPPKEEGKTVQLIGYIMAGASLIMPILALAGLVLGIITATKPNRGGHGAAIICLSLALGSLAFFFWAGVYSSDSA